MRPYCFRPNNQTVFLAAASLVGTDEVQSLQSDRRFRKASRNMLVSYSAIQKGFEAMGGREVVESIAPENRGLYFSSDHGELESTKDFLSFLAREERVRPLLFQNSLHNSTLGFVTQLFQIEGPGLTFSHASESAVTALQTAIRQLQNQQLELAIVLACDVAPKGYSDLLKLMPPKPCEAIDSAACLILTNQSKLAEYELSQWTHTTVQAPRADFLQSIAGQLLERAGDESLELCWHEQSQLRFKKVCN